MVDETDKKLQIFARDLQASVLAGAVGGSAAASSATQLARYAARHSAVIDLSLERHLRSNAQALWLYHGFLATQSVARSEMAAAASAGKIDRRVVGEHVVKLVDERGRLYLVVEIKGKGPVPSLIEVRGKDGLGCRVHLGNPIDGIVQQRLDPSNSDHKILSDLFRTYDTVIYLM